MERLSDAELARHSEVLGRIKAEMEKVIIGQETLIDRLLISLVCNQHVLIEGVPGLAKTLTVNTLAGVISGDFKRVQFTPDLLPADLLGTLIFNPREGDFTTKKGPLFANIILADEINRAPAKVQSALLEAMQERQITIGDSTFPLPDPFMVMATQNPIEQEGTYPLPEAQVDRFMMKVKIGYPGKAEELAILRAQGKNRVNNAVESVVKTEDILSLREALDRVYLDSRVEEYIVDLVQATRDPAAYGMGDMADLIRCGASPRAAIYLTLAARGYALINGRSYVTPQDIKSIGMDVLRHRVIISYEAEAEEKSSEEIVAALFDHLEVP
ncbi:MAG: AAA family ATPase [Spirochaetales bacterium]|nr:AAA family ATPase [Spirochaetales bacterium]